MNNNQNILINNLLANNQFININNILEDENLIIKLKNNFNNEEDIRLFEFNYNIYKKFKNNKNDFIVNFEDVYKYLGYNRKDNAKALLIKDFIENKDYIIEKQVSLKIQGNLGGRPIDNIMLNIQCFKKFCLLAGTQESKKIYNYYITIEESIMEYIEDYMNNQSIIYQKQIIDKDSQIVKLTKDKTLEKHKILLQQFGTSGPLIYILKVKSYSDNSYIIKIGQSRKGVLYRYNDHKNKYEEAILLDCFLVNQSEEFERFLHAQPKIKSNRVSNLDNHENEKELFLINNNLTYTELLNIITSNIKNFEDVSVERLKLECEKLNLLKNISEDNNINIFINELINTNKKLLEEIYDIKKDIRDIKANTLNSKTTNNFNEELTTIGPKVVKLHPETLQILKVYETASHCMKEDLLIRRPSLSKAIKDNTIYRGYRWIYVNRNQDLNTITNIPPTKITHVQNNDYIAVINKDKTKILNVYLDKKTCCKLLLNKTPSALDNAVKNGSLSNGYYFMLYSDVPEDLKTPYEEEYGKPILYKNGIGQFDSNHNLIREFVCKSECFRILKMSDRSLAKALDNKIMYNNYYYDYLKSKLKHI